MSIEDTDRIGTLFVSPSVSESDLGELKAVDSQPFSIFIEVDPDLDTRATGQVSVWLALYRPGYDILIGAAGSAAWAALVRAWTKIFKRHGRIRCMVSGDDGQIFISLEGSADDVKAALSGLPPLIRAIRSADSARIEQDGSE